MRNEKDDRYAREELMREREDQGEKDAIDDSKNRSRRRLENIY